MSTELARSVESSNLAHHNKSALRKLFDDVTGRGKAIASYGGKHIVAAGSGIRQGGEAVLIGGLLGIAHCELKNGLDIDGKVPVDAVAGVSGLALGTLFAHEEIGTDLRNAGASALSVFCFRKAYAISAAKRAADGRGAPGGAFHGEWTSSGTANDTDEDPIVQAARANAI